jgi:DNA-binding NarL/FixJ family response regulator
MTTDTANFPAAKKVLIVDDNKIYRDAYRRNLMLRNCVVTEAEDTDDALRRIQEDSPEIVITDLQMRTETEGIDLIRQVKSANPLLPVIMISAVGTFEEGALAQKCGASAVISKSRIEDEIDHLYRAIDEAHVELQRNHADEQTLQDTRAAISGDAPAPPDAVDRLRTLVANPATHPYLRAEGFNLYTEMNERQLKEEAKKAAETSAGGVMPRKLEDIEKVLREEMGAYNSFSDDSKESLRIAEFLYTQQAHTPGSIDFSRNIGFSYCFAVENEAKLRMAKRLQKFLGNDQTYVMVSEMMENNNQHLSVYYHQYLLLMMRGREMDITIDNVRQTFRRILEHQGRYKPDGLKALGIMVIAFGRAYTWTKKGKAIKVSNPLLLKGLETDEDLLRFGELLISLQHFRNPYIHPEISDLEKLSIIRKAAFECLNVTSRLQ